MVAVLAPTPISAPTARPNLRVIEGGRSARRRVAPGGTADRVYLRRRMVAGAMALVILAVLVVGVSAAASLLTAPVAPATTGGGVPTAATPIAAQTYVVRPGDTLWSIASRLDPDGDPRPLVDSLRERAGGAALEAGQRIDVAGLGA